LLHGYPQDEEHWIELGVLETYEALIAGDQIDPMVLILPYQPEPYFTQTDGGPNSFEEVFIDDLWAEMNERYNISERASERALLGVSRGGVWALEIGMRHAELFNIVAALSPALAYNHPRRAYDPFDIALTIDEIPEHILISAGDREPQFADEINRFADTLEQADISYLYIRNEGRHEDAAWQGIMGQVLHFTAEAMDG
jgi:enterochelin esterase-like enzyme